MWRIAPPDREACLAAVNAGNSWPGLLGSPVGLASTTAQRTINTDSGPVERGAPIIMGSLERQQVDTVVQSHEADLVACIVGAQPPPANSQGEWVIRFTVTPSGTVSKAEIRRSTLNNTVIEDCVSTLFTTMQFPEPRGGGVVIVSYPLTLAPG